MAARRRHATCKIRFEDADRHLHNVVVRVAPKGAITALNLARLVRLKTGLWPARMAGVVCMAAKGGSKSFRLGPR